MQRIRFPITLMNAYMLTNDVKHFIFHVNEEVDFSYIPGQFITIHFTHNQQNVIRSYSIANHPTSDRFIEITASYIKDGVGSKFLFNLKPNDNVNITGPFGRLILRDPEPQRYILVATSTGITPYRAMLPILKQYIQGNPLFKVVILQGVQTNQDILFAKEFKKIAEECPQITFRAQLSQQNTNLNAHEYSGYVQSAFDELNLNVNEDRIYLCGNPAMIDDSFQYLKNFGFITQQIIREKYIS